MAESVLQQIISFVGLLLELIWIAIVALFHLIMLLGGIALDFFYLLLTTLKQVLLQL
jgi:hypothetical protein